MFGGRMAREIKRRDEEEGNHLLRRRATECMALTMMGDGALGFIAPEGHVQLWLRGPRLWRRMLQPFADHPQLTRWVGAAEFAAGAWLALHQEEEQE